ncbi:MAG: NrdR family transcriptional regulator [Acidobacteriaceae bacterium]
MECPRCGAETKVINSRQMPLYVRRRRMCLECGHRFSTIEVSRDEAVIRFIFRRYFKKDGKDGDGKKSPGA